jgi:hypothetical protein
MKSLSEIETISKRSTRAAGFSWGIAEEVGKNIRILELFGLGGIINLNYYFRVKNKKKYEKLHLISSEIKISKSEFCPILAGLSFLDQVRSLEDLKEIKLEKIAFPILFLPFVSRASEIIGKKLELKIDSKTFLLNYNNSIYSNSLDSGILTIGNDIQITFQQNRDSFEENEWKELYKLSENTFVEENESLKQSGAGAGLTDND